MYSMNSGPESALERFETVLAALSSYESEETTPQQLLDFQLALVDQKFPLSKFSASFVESHEQQRALTLGDIGYMHGEVGKPDFTVLCNIRSELGDVLNSTKLDSESSVSPFPVYNH